MICNTQQADKSALFATELRTLQR